MVDFKEIGSSGLREYSGFIEEAFAAELRWPACEPLYRRLLRSDPEMTMVRLTFGALARSQTIDWELPENPSDGDKQAQEFAQSVTDDLADGVGSFLEKAATRVPFMGWGWWEVLPGLRDPKWKPPGEDDWQSEYKDGRVGIRRLAWRDSSSFQGWDMSDNGRVRGMVQMNFPHPSVTIPIENSLHLTFGDADNPEGLALLEAVWRLERIKYGLEVIQGIGFEHAAGYLSVTAENGLTDQDKANIQAAARAIMTAQEGNYAAWPKGVTGELIDTPFGAAPAILESIRYFGLLKLMVCNMQWMALSSVSGSGSYAAMNDSSSMAVMTYNAMMDGFAAQFDAQVGRRLFRWNQFPGMTRRPRAVIPHIEKVISLTELAAILRPLAETIPLGKEDQIAIRRKSNLLPVTLPTDDEIINPPAPASGNDEAGQDDEGEGEPAADDDQTDEEPGEGEEGESAPEPREQARALELAQRTKYWIEFLKQHPEAMNGNN
jgi:hypothetical protein